MKFILPSIVLFLLMVETNVHAQSGDILNDTITFTCSGFQDQLAKVPSEYECKFTICKNQVVIWDQNNGEVVFELPVSRTEGRWKNVSNDGSIIYRFKFDNKGDGRLTISRKNDTFRILFDLRGLENGDILNEYTVTKVEKN